MLPLPKPVALVLCQKVDVAAGRFSLVGLFHIRRFPVFPTPVQRFTVYVALHGGMGEGTMSLAIARAETENKIYVYQRWMSFADRDRVYDIEIRVRTCVFPAAGRYLCSLWFDNQIVTDRILDVLWEVPSS